MNIIKSNNLTAAELTAKYVIPHNERQRAADEARKAAQAAILPDVAALFDAYPDLQKIEVEGITPYFNDGDPCVHSQRDATVNGYGEPKYDGGGYWTEGDGPEPAVEVYRAVNAIVSGMADTFEVAFGTHWTLTFTRTDGGMAWTREDNTDHD